MGRVRPRPAAGRIDDHGGDSRTRRIDRPDGFRRAIGWRGQASPATTCVCIRSARPCSPPGWRSWSRCGGPRARDRKVAIPIFAFPPNAGNIGTAQYLAVFESLHRHAGGAQAGGLFGRAAGQSRRFAASGRRRQRGALRQPCQRACAHPGRRPCPARALVARDRTAMGGRTRSPADRRCVVVRPGRALRQRLRRHPAGLRIRRRPDAPPVREGLRADPCLLGVLSLDPRGFRRPCRAAFRHARCA